MKHIGTIGKFAALSLAATFTLSGCGAQVTSTSNNESFSATAASITSTTFAATTAPTNSAQLSKEYLKTDSTKGEAYNAAIKAYNEFLSGKINAKDKTTDKTINIHDMDNINCKPGINSFALFDVNGDGIPELHTRSLFYDIFSYQDNQVVHWYQSHTNFMDGSAYTLENGALFSVHDSTGRDYNYTTFGPNGTASTISFFDAASFDGEAVPENAPYFFNDKKVSKEDYDKLTKDYIAFSKKPASMEWHDYEQ